MTDTDKNDERRARELLRKLDLDSNRHPVAIKTIGEAFQEVRAERDAELQRAMVVIDWCIGHVQRNPELAHTTRAKLVEAGFIDETNARVRVK